MLIAAAKVIACGLGGYSLTPMLGDGSPFLRLNLTIESPIDSDIDSGFGPRRPAG
jgi:hypothetical protein